MTSASLSDPAVALRPWTDADAAAIVECIDGDPEISRWLDQIPQPYTLADARAYIAGTTGNARESRFAVTDAASDRILGSIGATWNETGDVAEIGYWLRADARGAGVTTRALHLIVPWAFAEGAQRIQLRARVENAASRRVAEKVGFQLEGVLRSAYFNPRLGHRHDWMMYSLLPGEHS
ncbi:MAG TPA: GNAT family N-acetyltransferase [Gaiellaceae bacterium]|jgi:RimJ/RimL family protein N-acetyltransferase|nr:GNAT family N-acetyltransferase [Gaiellaceae bacterium]